MEQNEPKNISVELDVQDMTFIANLFDIAFKQKGIELLDPINKLRAKITAEVVKQNDNGQLHKVEPQASN